MFVVFGIEDPAIWVGYGLSLVLTLACVIYGILNWNRGGREHGR